VKNTEPGNREENKTKVLKEVSMPAAGTGSILKNSLQA
jgi:hypothetical protein